MDTAELVELGRRLRVDSVRASVTAGSGHRTSSMSAADLVAVLFAHHFRYDFDRPAHPGNDRFVLSKGHASPLMYAAYKAVGAIDDEELLTFRTLGSRPEGHPTPQRLPWVETATGSLGQGLPLAVGIALAGQRLDRAGYRVRVLCGNSEREETGLLMSVEDHHEQGGLGDAVLDAFLDGRPVPRLVRLAVRTMPGSANPAGQLHAAGIDAESIAASARLLVEQAIVP